MKILITGGAGYIASHVLKHLLEKSNHEIIVLDNLTTGHQSTIDTLKKIRFFKFVKMDLKEFSRIDRLFEDYHFDVVMHFAASIIVPESVSNPLKYYMNNTLNTTNLIQSAIKNDVKQFIFSSTAAVYGEPTNLQKNGIDEDYPTNPINPYGMSKLMSERILQDCAKAHTSFKYIIFRYFNVAGADIYYKNNILSPRIGQSSPNATHLIKVASECATYKRAKMEIFGSDYDTKDGSGVRDYIHVDDLAQAHIQAIEYLNENSSDIFNIGYGKGYSVKEVIAAMEEVAKTKFDVRQGKRRLGDPAILIANNQKITNKMKWKPQYDDLNLICESVFRWESK